ncbi:MULTISPECIES: ArsR family transcriptional regulator [Metallosphaera]|uniref:ArsR family transcriptional regulator n=1 Tax=Metallosphaera TaxID=41980 RepID=UPI001F058EB5|nr:ArsR family transcriptional regulator [Metallosphaera sedula]MCH1770160.1 ArsR family transcriptional regulator [Metallosphaera sedula]MCP6728006.1 ArsR family transcriptional regulator [Metallosphaera sedula]
MNIRQLRILTLLLEGELSTSEIEEYTGISGSRLKKELDALMRRDLIEQKAIIGGELILSITQNGIEELMREYPVLKDLLEEMEQVLCLRFGC